MAVHVRYWYAEPNPNGDRTRVRYFAPLAATLVKTAASVGYRNTGNLKYLYWSYANGDHGSSGRKLIPRRVLTARKHRFHMAAGGPRRLPAPPHLHRESPYGFLSVPLALRQTIFTYADRRPHGLCLWAVGSPDDPQVPIHAWKSMPVSGGISGVMAGACGTTLKPKVRVKGNFWHAFPFV